MTASATKQFPTSIGKDKVSSTIFTYKDMHKVFKRQINRIKMSSTIQAGRQTQASTAQGSHQQNSKSVLNTPSVTSPARKEQESRAEKHNLTL